jgi:peroxiredoxin
LFAGYDILNSDKLDKIYEIYKGGELSEYILINKLDFASSTQNAKALKDLYNEYFEYYSESTYAPRIKQQYDPNIRIRVGNKAPNFTIKDINGNSINLSDYKGKYLMIDFWATWCGPCMKEMPQLHKAYEKFSGDNFEVLSLSFDKSPEAIDRMRDGSRFKMPWEHAFVNNGFKSDLAKTYEVSGIPKPILIDPNGIIVAVGGELRGANLELTLSRLIDN